MNKAPAATLGIIGVAFAAGMFATIQHAPDARATDLELKKMGTNVVFVAVGVPAAANAKAILTAPDGRQCVATANSIYRVGPGQYTLKGLPTKASNGMSYVPASQAKQKNIAGGELPQTVTLAYGVSTKPAQEAGVNAPQCITYPGSLRAFDQSPEGLVSDGSGVPQP